MLISDLADAWTLWVSPVQNKLEQTPSWPLVARPVLVNRIMQVTETTPKVVQDILKHLRLECKVRLHQKSCPFISAGLQAIPLLLLFSVFPSECEHQNVFMCAACCPFI